MSGLPKVLYVEDNGFDVLMLERLLSEYQLGVELRVFADGEAFLCALSDEPELVHGNDVLVLLDLNLPKLNGLEVLDRMRAKPEWYSLPVIVYTTSSLESEKSQVRSFECVVAFLEKNGPERLLIERMKSVFLERVGINPVRSSPSAKRAERLAVSQANTNQLPSKINCLYVEDDREDAIALQRLCLTDYGVHLDTAFSTEMASQKLAQKDYDCLILDQYLPGETGIAFAEKLRSMAEYRQLSIIMISNWPDDQLIVRAKSFGVHYFISKDDLYQVSLPEILRSAMMQQNKEEVYVEQGLPDISEMDASEQARYLRYSMTVINDGVRGKQPHYITLGQLVSELRVGLQDLLKRSNSQLFFDRSKSIGIDNSVLYNLTYQLLEELLLVGLAQGEGSTSQNIAFSFYAIGMNRVRLSIQAHPRVKFPSETPWSWLFNAHARIVGGEVRFLAEDTSEASSSLSVLSIVVDFADLVSLR